MCPPYYKSHVPLVFPTACEGISTSSLPSRACFPLRWPGGWPTDGRTTAHRQQKKKKHHVKEKYIKRDTESKLERVRSHSVVSPAGFFFVFFFYGSAESEWTERERSSHGTSPASARLPFTPCPSVSRWGWYRRIHRGKLESRVVFLVRRLLMRGKNARRGWELALFCVCVCVCVQANV